MQFFAHRLLSFASRKLNFIIRLASFFHTQLPPAASLPSAVASSGHVCYVTKPFKFLTFPTFIRRVSNCVLLIEFPVNSIIVLAYLY